MSKARYFYGLNTHSAIFLQRWTFFEPFLSFFASGSNISMIIYEGLVAAVARVSVIPIGPTPADTKNVTGPCWADPSHTVNFGKGNCEDDILDAQERKILSNWTAANRLKSCYMCATALVSPNDTALRDRTASCWSPLCATDVAAIIQLAARSSDNDTLTSTSWCVEQKRKWVKSVITLPKAMPVVARVRSMACLLARSMVHS